MSRSVLPLTTPARFVLGLALSAILCACSERVVPLPSTISIDDPTQPIRDLEVVENLSEEVADRLLSLGELLTRRDFASSADYFAGDFAGHALGSLPEKERSPMPLGAEKRVLDSSAPTIVSREDFVGDLERLLGAWSRVELVLWKVKGAEFQAGPDHRPGKIRLFLDNIGDLPSGGREEITAWAWALAERRKGIWRIARFQLESAERARIEDRPFHEISAAAGVAHLGIRYGQPGNTEDAWNGAACGDVDGYGRWDIFVPGAPRNFLYLARAEGGFREAAEERGLAHPGGGTGPVLFDHDNDGDQDLFVTHRAWVEGGKWQGETLRLYRNDGRGRFEDVSEAVGLAVRRYGFSATAWDYDQDGWVDLFVCGYGRMASQPNDSWIQARNGAPNSLFKNHGGERFEDVAAAIGIAGTSWTYASAAADYDEDGDLDLYVANDYGVKELWKNDGKGGFMDVAADLGVTDVGNGMGVTWGDLDGDGRLDLYVSNMSSTAGNRILGRLAESVDESVYADLKKLASGNSIFLADPEGGFRRQAASAGGINGSWAWSAALCDLDLDGALDVYCASGFVSGDQAADT